MTDENRIGGEIGPLDPHALAGDNLERWGEQDEMELMMAIIEETGELAEELLPNECPEHLELSVGLSWECGRRQVRAGRGAKELLEDGFEGAGGEPLPEDERPALVEPRDDLIPERVRSEALDLMALLLQLDAALEGDGP